MTRCREPVWPKTDPPGTRGGFPSPAAPMPQGPIWHTRCQRQLQLLHSAVILLSPCWCQQMGWRGTKLEKTSVAHWKPSLPVQCPDWDFCPLSISLDNTHRSCTEKMSARMKAPGQPNKPGLRLQFWRLTSRWQRLSPPWRWLGPTRVCEEDSHHEVTPAELSPHSTFSETTKRR